MYINFLEEGVTSKILKFADDTTLFRKIKGNWYKQQSQDDIDKVITWSEKLQMLFCFEKCKCLLAVHGNTGVNYEMAGTILCKTVLSAMRVTPSVEIEANAVLRLTLLLHLGNIQRYTPIKLYPTAPLYNIIIIYDTILRQ